MSDEPQDLDDVQLDKPPDRDGDESDSPELQPSEDQ